MGIFKIANSISLIDARLLRFYIAVVGFFPPFKEFVHFTEDVEFIRVGCL